ncbi:MAG: hypothetical protein WC501_02075 [Candidatus Micrarchaeia archaeon]
MGFDLKKWGPYVFLIGFVIAVVLSIAGSGLEESNKTMLLWVLGLLGIVVGLVNVGDKESMPFLIAVIALLQLNYALEIFKTFPALSDVLPIVTDIISYLTMFLMPAALIVALKLIYDLAGEGSYGKVSHVFVGKKKR